MTPGRYFLQKILPPQYYELLDGPLDKKSAGVLFTKMAKEMDPDEYARVIKVLNNFGNKVANEYGGVASVHLRDLRLTPRLQKMRRDLEATVQKIAQTKGLSAPARNRLIIEQVQKATPEIDKAVMEELKQSDNSFGLMVGAGIKGKPQQLRQLVFGDLLSVDSNFKPIPYPTFRSYGEGVTPMQFVAASHGGRQGYIGVQKATADAGYFSKQVRQPVSRQRVTADDCGHARPYMVNADDTDNVGSLLYADTRGKSGKVYKKDTPITPEMLRDLNGKIAVRSATTCGEGDGVCAKCAGIKEDNKLPDIGDEIGLNAANDWLQRLAQAGLGSKHGGGEASTAGNAKRGLAAVDQFMNMPETFVGGAVIADVDGTVGEPLKAPQGGWYLPVGGESLYVPADRKLLVKKGDKVESGDILTDGMPNMREIVEEKGIGEGRRLFVDSLRTLLQESGAPTQRKNIEALARGFINRVQITDPDGYDGWIVGDIAEDNVLEKRYEQSKDSREQYITDAEGKYLETPTLHYSIGTRVTPSVIQNLQKANVRKILVNENPPPFKPYQSSARAFAEDDEDWLAALGGEGLTRSFIEHVERGADTDPNSTSYYPRIALMNAHQLGGKTNELRLAD